MRLKLQLFGQKKSNEQVAKEVIQGKWGNGTERKNALTKAGYNYSTIQGIVNSSLSGSSNKNTTTNKNTNTNTNTNKNTKTTTTPATKPKGVDQTTWNNANSSYENSDKLNGYEDAANSAYSNAESILNRTDIIDQSTKDAMNKPLEFSDAYYEAQALTDSLLKNLLSGETKWTALYDQAVNDYLNREDFEYDVDKDPLFQQALASAMNSGRTAMQDTIGQASALTGGYGSTYATSAGNQAYNAYIEDAYNNLPEYYQMALNAYQAEGEEMYNRVSMLGSADASEQIWHAVKTLQAKGLPVVVSMGDYAASGGYYISCCADYIYAEPTTLTGSIGIFGTVPNMSKLMDKIGLDIDGVSTNQHSDLTVNAVYKGMNKQEMALMQSMVERGYDLFTKRCADGRSMSQDDIKKIGEGRVWLGKDALEIGLVDELGNINNAIAKAAELANLGQYAIVDYPEKTDPFEELLKMFDTTTPEERFIMHVREFASKPRIMALTPEVTIQ